MKNRSTQWDTLSLLLTVIFSIAAILYTVSLFKQAYVFNVKKQLESQFDDSYRPAQNEKIYYLHSEPEHNEVDDEETALPLLLYTSVQYSAKPVTQIEVVVEPKIQATKENITLLAKLITAEAGSCSKDEKARVGIVPLNRIKTDYWEFSEINTIEDALNQKNSYPITKRKIDNGLQPNEESLLVAEQLLNGTIDVDFGDFADDDLVLWQTKVKPNWNAQVVYQSKWHYYSVLENS